MSRGSDRGKHSGHAAADNARTFGHKTVVDSYVNDGAYTTCVPVGGNQVLMLYYADAPGALPELRSVRLRVS